MMKKTDIQSTFSRFVSFFRSSKSDSKNEDNLSTKTGGARMQRRGEITDTSEFEDYLQSIPKKQVNRMKNRKGNTSRTVTNNALNMSLVEKCYKTIPASYFIEHQQQLDLALFSRNRKKLEHAQQQVSSYLDQIELCLFNQVTSRFDQFISILRTNESLDILVNDNLNYVKAIRKANKKLAEGLVKKAQRVNAVQKKLENILKVKKVLEKIKLVETARQIIKEKINRDKDSCVDIIDQLRRNKEELLKLECMEDYEDKIEQCEFVIKKDFTENFTQEMFNYISSAVQYKKVFWENLVGRNDLLAVDSKDLTNSTVFLDEDVLLEDTVQTCNPQAQQTILDIVINGWKNGQLAVAPTKNRLEEYLTKIFNGFIEDLRGFCIQTLQQAKTPVPEQSDISRILQPMSLEFYSKILQYYSTIHIKLLRRLSAAIKKIVEYLVQASVECQESLKSHCHNLVEAIFNIPLSISKFLLEKFVQLLNFKKLAPGLQFFRFRSYIGLFEMWQNFFTQQIQQIFKFQVPVECPFRDRVFVLRSKLNNHQITTSKNQLVGIFLQNLHKNVMGRELRQAMEDDTWQPVDIPIDFYDPIGYLLTGQTWSNRAKNIQTTVLQCSIMVERSGIRRFAAGANQKQKSIRQQVPQSKLNMRIIKNECMIQNRTYKFSQSFLLLIEILEEYVRIAENFPNTQNDVAAKIAQIIRFYNSYSCQLIIGAAAVVLGKIKSKNITARHLCICSLCLEMLILILTKVGQRVKMPELPKLVQALKCHHVQVVKKLKTIMMAKVQMSLNDVELKLVPSKGTLGIVTSAKTLFDILQDFIPNQYIKQIFDKDMFVIYTSKMQKFQIDGQTKAELLKEQIGFYFNELKFLQEVVPEYWQLRQTADALIVRVFEAL